MVTGLLRRLGGAACLISALLAGCGSDSPAPEQPAGPEPAVVSANSLAQSMTESIAGFLRREDTTVSRTMDRTLRGETNLAVLPATVECRRGSSTDAISDAESYPYACIATAAAAAQGLSTKVTLGFVITSVQGGCWIAQNERLAPVGGAPVLYPRRVALARANRLEDCVGGAADTT